MKELIEKLVFTALVEASMCWSETPKSVFQSEKAKEIGDKLVNELQAITSVKSESAEDKKQHAIGFGIWILQSQYKKQQDGQLVWWANDFSENAYASDDLYNEYLTTLNNK